MYYLIGWVNALNSRQGSDVQVQPSSLVLFPFSFWLCEFTPGMVRCNGCRTGLESLPLNPDTGIESTSESIAIASCWQLSRYIWCHEVSLLVNMSCMWAMLQIRRFRRFLRCPGKGNSRRCTISQRWIGGQKSGTSVTIVSSSLGISRSAGVRRQTFEHEVNSANWCLVLAVRHKNWSDNSIRSFFLSPQSLTTPGQRNPTCIHCLLEETTTLLLRSWMCKYQVIVLKRTWFLLHQIAYIFTASYSLRCCQVKTSPF